MKNYKQLIKALPSKNVVFMYGDFNIPTAKHESFIKVSKKIAESKSADHLVYISNDKNLLSEKKEHYLNLLFPNTKFVYSESTLPYIVDSLSKKYKSIHVVVSEDKQQECEKYLNGFNNVTIVPVSEKHPDTESSKLKSLITKGAYSLFKESLPSIVRDIDGKLLMNDLRHGMGLEPIKEQVKFTVDELREKYFRGEIYHIGDLVESAGTQYEIVDRGNNYLVVVDEQGNLHRKWIKDVQIVEVKTFKQFNEDIQPGPAPKEITYKGYTTKNLHHSADAAKAFQDTIEKSNKGLVPNDPVAILNALKSTDAYMKLNDMHLEQGRAPNPDEVQSWVHLHDMARKSLEKIGEFSHHLSYWQAHKTELEFMEAGKPEAMEESLSNKTLKQNQDKLKVARVIADMLGVENAKKMSNPEQLVNAGLRKVRSKSLNKDFLLTVRKMIGLANEVNIKYDPDLVQFLVKEQKDDLISPEPKKSNYNIAIDVLRYSDYMNLKKMTGGQLPTREAPKDLSHTSPGHSMETDTHLRRRKVRYATESVVDEQVSSVAKSYKQWLKDKNLDHSPENTEKYKKEIEKPVSEGVLTPAGNYTVKLKHVNKDGSSSEHSYEVKNAKNDRHAAWIAMQQHEKKHPDYKSVTAIEKKLHEDLATADYKVNPETGRKYRAHRINFANSKMGGKPDETPDNQEDEKEYKRKLKTETVIKKKIAKVDPVTDDSDLLNSIGQNGFDPFFKEDEDVSDEDLDKMIDSLSDDDIIDHAYDDDEFVMVDDETGEVIKEDVELLDEVLSRSERIRARTRFARTKIKRERKVKIALKKYSSAPVINNRARKLAIKLMKQRLTRGRPLSKLSVGEKERIERVVQKRKKIINRLAMRLVPRVRKIEKARLSHTKVTGGTPSVAF